MNCSKEFTYIKYIESSQLYEIGILLLFIIIYILHKREAQKNKMTCSKLHSW